MHWDWIQIQAVMRIRMNYYTDLDPDPESGNFSYRSKSGSTNLDPHVINFWKKVFLKLRKKKFSFKKDLSKKQQENILFPPKSFSVFIETISVVAKIIFIFYFENKLFKFLKIETGCFQNKNMLFLFRKQGNCKNTSRNTVSKQTPKKILFSK